MECDVEAVFVVDTVHSATPACHHLWWIGLVVLISPCTLVKWIRRVAGAAKHLYTKACECVDIVKEARQRVAGWRVEVISPLRKREPDSLYRGVKWLMALMIFQHNSFSVHTGKKKNDFDKVIWKVAHKLKRLGTPDLDHNPVTGTLFLRRIERNVC